METVPCDLCGSWDHVDVVTTKNYLQSVADVEAWFRVCQCRGCGLVFTNPRPSGEEITRYYEGYYLHQGVEGPEHCPLPPRLERARRPRWLAALLNNRATPLPDLPPGSRVLELGSATGTFLSSLRYRGWELQGVELSAQAAEQARSVLGLDVRAGTLEDAAYPPSSFDLVFGWHVVEHLPHPTKTLREVARILRPGGRLIFSVPNAGCWERFMFRRYWSAYQPPIHYYHFSPRTIRDLLVRAGFEKVSVLHQRTIAYVPQSLGAFLSERNILTSVAGRCLRFGDGTMPMERWISILTYPVALALAGLRQSGRLTVLAFKAACA